MNNFGRYITPEEARNLGDHRSLQELQQLAAAPPETCHNCDEQIWRFGGCGLCFSCTTGEADAEDDYELIYTPKGDSNVRVDQEAGGSP